MTREEYINEVLSQVKSKYAKLEIEQELNAHIDDRIEYYTDAGYNYEYALYKAMEYMGEPEQVGANMNSIHNETPLLVASIILQGLFILSMLIMNLIIRYSTFIEAFGLKYELATTLQLFIIVLLFTINYYICSRHGFNKPTLALSIEALLLIPIYEISIMLHSYRTFDNILFIDKLYTNVFSGYTYWFMVLGAIVAFCYSMYQRAKLKQKVHSTIGLRYYGFTKVFAFLTILLLGLTIFIGFSV